MALTLFTLTNVSTDQSDTSVCPTAFHTMDEAVESAREEWDSMTGCDGDFDESFDREDEDGVARFTNEGGACYLVTRVTLG